MDYSWTVKKNEITFYLLIQNRGQDYLRRKEQRNKAEGQTGGYHINK